MDPFADALIASVAGTLLTPRQQEAWRLHSIGVSDRGIALVQACGRTTVRDRIAQAHVKVHAVGIRLGVSGWYLDSFERQRHELDLQAENPK